MPLYSDPYTADAARYECLECGEREVAAERVSECSACGGDVHNVAVPRE